MAHLRAIRNHILFRFEDDFVKHMGVRQFESKTSWGFSIVRADESTQDARWGTVLAVGPEVDADITVGARVLIEPLKWTNEVVFEGESYWRTDNSAILAIDET